MRTLLLACVGLCAQALVAPAPRAALQRGAVARPAPSPTALAAAPDEEEEELFGGFTAKQRIREEIESPFRRLRLTFFGASTVSALLALYFSLLNVAKAYGHFPDAPPLDESLTSCGINVAAVIACALITRNDLVVQQSKLERIKQGGALAKLVVSPAATPAERVPLRDFRRNARVVLAVGGEAFVEGLAATFAADASLPSRMAAVDVILVPVLQLQTMGT